MSRDKKPIPKMEPPKNEVLDQAEYRDTPNKPASNPNIRPEAKEQAVAGPADKEWRDHEHKSPVTDKKAREMVDHAGSEGLAKKAIDDAVEDGKATETG